MKLLNRPSVYAQSVNFLLARKHQDFALAVNGLYGASIRGIRAPASLKQSEGRCARFSI